jgi:putative membrane protein
MDSYILFEEYGMSEKLKACAGSALLLPTLALAQSAQPGPYRDWGDWPGPWHMTGWGWGFGWIFPLLMMVMLALCVFFMIRMFGGHGNLHRDHTASALQLLNERFAKGEISKEEFEEKRTILARRP